MNGRIIEFLRNKGDFVSGEEISRSLGITRAGVWKKVKNLRQTGYSIEAVPSKGYRLVNSPDMPTEQEINAVFRGDIIGRKILFYETIRSTNDKAMEIGPSCTEGTIVIADSQEHGRGRFNRQWVSPPGVNLYFTVLLKPPFPPGDAAVLTLMAAVAVASAIRENEGLDAVIKWPNDILISNKKVGGILTEMRSDMDRIDFVAVGIGLNINMPLSTLPTDIRALTTSLKKEKGKTVSRVELLGAVLSKFEHWYKTVLKGGEKALLDEWQRFDATIGKKVSVRVGDRVITGVAQGINEHGALIIKRSSGSIERLNAGEVTILKR